MVTVTEKLGPATLASCVPVMLFHRISTGPTLPFPEESPLVKAVPLTVTSLFAGPVPELLLRLNVWLQAQATLNQPTNKKTEPKPATVPALRALFIGPPGSNSCI